MILVANRFLPPEERKWLKATLGDISPRVQLVLWHQDNSTMIVFNKSDWNQLTGITQTMLTLKYETDKGLNDV
jgi:hypothetical protein